MHLVVDLDDTIANTAKIICKYAKKYHTKILKRKYKKKKLNDVADYFYFAEELDWNDSDLIGFFDYYYPFYLEKVKPIKNVRRVFNLLQLRGWKIHIVSARKYSEKKDVLEITKKWLEKYKINYDTLDIDKENKSNIAQFYNCNVFIDDSYKNCIDIQQIKSVRPILFCTKYNIKYQNESISCLNNWEEFINMEEYQ